MLVLKMHFLKIYVILKSKKIYSGKVEKNDSESESEREREDKYTNYNITSYTNYNIHFIHRAAC